MNPVVFRLYGDSSKALLLQHLLRLSSEDRYLRFMTSISDDGIRRYVEKIDLDERDFVFGASVKPDELIAAVHVGAYNDHEAELGISVDVPYRRTGIGSKLFERAMHYVRARGFKTLFVSCLSTNVPMQGLVKKFQGTISAEGPEHLGKIELPARPNVFELQRLMNEDIVAMFDLSMRPVVEQWWQTIYGPLVGRGRS